MRYFRLAAVSLLGASGCAPTVEPPAMYCAPAGQPCLRVHLSHVVVPFFQQFERRLDLLSVDRPLLSEELLPHDLRWLRMNLYGAGPSILILREGQWGESLWQIDVALGTIGLVTPTMSPIGDKTFIGAFDVDQRNRWRFIPAAERAELSLPEWER